MIKERKVQVLSSPETAKFFETTETSGFSVQERFKASWNKYFADRIDDPDRCPFTEGTKELLLPLASQMDISLLCKPENPLLEQEYRALYCLQAMQIAMTARSRILKHTQTRLLNEANNNSSDTAVERDQDSRAHKL